VLGGATKELFNLKEVPGVDGAPSTFEIAGTKPFVPYSTNPADYVAGFSPLQRQVQANAANLQMPSQFNYATDMAGAAGQGALDSAGQAYGYGNAGFQSGQLGQQLGIQGGQYYGGMGAGYGQQGAGYGAQAADVGQMGLRAEQYGRQSLETSRRLRPSSRRCATKLRQASDKPGCLSAIHESIHAKCCGFTESSCATPEQISLVHNVDRSLPVLVLTVVPVKLLKTLKPIVHCNPQ
jgi:hypothetical protein